MPGSETKMVTYGGVDMTERAPDGQNMELPKDNNKGRHVIYAGRKYDNFLY